MLRLPSHSFVRAQDVRMCGYLPRQITQTGPVVAWSVCLGFMGFWLRGVGVGVGFGGE